MKQYLLVGGAVMVTLSSAAVLAEDAYHDEPAYGAVQTSTDLNLVIEQSGTSLDVSWDAYDGDDFKWYKVVYSPTNAAPSYPDDRSVHVVVDQDVDRVQFGTDTVYKGGYYRLCVITVENERYCSNVVSLDAIEKTAESYDKPYRKESADHPTKKPSSDRDELRQRVDKLMNAFFAKLNRTYYGAKRVEVLRTVRERIEMIAEEKPHVAPVAAMIIDRIDEKITEYDTGWDEIQDILDESF